MTSTINTTSPASAEGQETLASRLVCHVEDAGSRCHVSQLGESVREREGGRERERERERKGERGRGRERWEG